MKIEKIASSAEYASIGLSFLGSIAAIATQQLAYISAPLALSASLSLLNRKRELGSANQHIALLEQQLASHHQSTSDRLGGALRDRMDILGQSLASIPPITSF